MTWLVVHSVSHSTGGTNMHVTGWLVEIEQLRKLYKIEPELIN